MHYTYLATAPFGLEGVVAGELRRMGIENVSASLGGASFKATPEQAFRAALWMRAGDRILQLVGEFQAMTFDELFEGTKALAWENYIGRLDAFPVSGKCVRSQLMSISDCQSIVKKAVVERMKKKFRIDWFEESGAKVGIYFALSGNLVSLYLDCTGEGLHRRGYRPLMGEAPLRETLGAAMIMLSPWRKDKPFCDPMCGTGTLAIEAAMIAMELAPGRMRPMECESWGWMPKGEMAILRQEAKQPPTGQAPPIFASDMDKEAVEKARIHARRAGVEAQIRIEQKNAASVRHELEGGAFLVNPPYGQRLTKDVEESYRELRILRDAHPSWTLSVLSAHHGFERIYGRKADKRRRLYNGRLECDFVTYFEKPGSVKKN